MDATKSERRGEHTDIFPIEFFLLLALDKHLSQAMRDVLPGLHTLLNRQNHTAINLKEIVVKLGSTSMCLGGNPLERFDEVD